MPRLPIPGPRAEVPAWELPHAGADAALLRDLRATIVWLWGFQPPALRGEEEPPWTPTTLRYALRYRSEASVYLAGGWPHRGRICAHPEWDGRGLRVLRHERDGSKIILSRAETAALRRAAAPYLEAGRARDAAAWAEARRLWGGIEAEGCLRDRAIWAERRAALAGLLRGMRAEDRVAWREGWEGKLRGLYGWEALAAEAALQQGG